MKDDDFEANSIGNETRELYVDGWLSQSEIIVKEEICLSHAIQRPAIQMVQR